MKALAYSVFLLMGVHLVALNAQVRVGAFAGTNIASLTVPDDLLPSATRKMRLGLVVGGTAELQLSDLLSLRIDPRFIQKGFRTEITDATGTTKSAQTINYLEIPLSAIVTFAETDIRPFLLGGANLGFILSASEDATLSDGQTIPTLDTKSNYKSYDFAFDVGGGIEYVFSPNTSLVGLARYSFGLTNVYQVPGYNGKTRNLQFQVGALLAL